MTEARAKAAEPRPDALATLSDHLARLLAHADKLLREWEAHADGVRAKLDADTRSAGEVLERALSSALTGLSDLVGKEIDRGVAAKASHLREDLDRASHAAAELLHTLQGSASPRDNDLRAGFEELRGDIRALSGKPAPGRRYRPDQLLLVLVVLANAMLGGLLILFLARPAPKAPPPPAPTPTEPAAIVTSSPDAAPPPAPPAPAAAAPARSPCAGLAVETGMNAPRLVQVCVNQLCSPFPPLKVDGAIKPGGALGKALAACKAAHDDLLAALQALERDKALYRLACPLPEKNEDGTVSVTVRWLLGCPAVK